MKPLSEYKEGSQNRDILTYINKNGFITAMGAALIGITQFHARIFELKTDGYVFATIRVIPKDNGKKWYYEYSLDKGKLL